MTDKIQDYEGIKRNKRIFLLAIGLCPTIALTTTLENSLAVGVNICFVIIISNILNNLIAPVIPEKIREIVNIIIVAVIVTVLRMILQAYFLEFYKEIGIYIPLIGLNSILLRNSGVMTREKEFWAALRYEVKIGIELTISLGLIGFVREVLGSGMILETSVFGEGFEPVLLVASPAGALLVTSILLAIINKVHKVKSWKNEVSR